jgi:DNA-binding transcriptional regulator YiaG
MLRSGKFGQAEFARRLCISRTAVSKWAIVLEDNGMKGLKKERYQAENKN